jgi:hypothetical protein
MFFEDTDGYLLTYPRSGKTWLDWYIKNNTDLNILSGHYVNIKDYSVYESGKICDEEMLGFKIQSDALKNKNKIFSIARNPIDSLTSINIMENFHSMEFRYYQYIDHYDFILNNVDIIFYYEDVVKNTKMVTEKICKKFNKNIKILNENFKEYQKWHLNNKSKVQLVTSKNDLRYNLSLETIKKWNLKKHQELYQEVLKKCINI